MIMFPKELIDIIYSFDPTHREKMKPVFNELFFKYHQYNMIDVFDELYDRNMVQCCNENCLTDDTILSYDESIRVEILENTYTFCCEDCADEGEYWIRYDIRKSCRRITKMT